MTQEREKYTKMGDHDILVEVAVRQEIMTETVDAVVRKVEEHDTLITRQTAICEEARKTIFNEVNRLRDENPAPARRRSVKEQAAIGGGSLTLFCSIIFSIGKAAGWW